MTIEEAIKLIHPDSSANAIAELEYYSGFDRDKVVDSINEAAKLVCDEVKKLPTLSEDGTLTITVPDGSKVTRVFVCGENHYGGLFYPEECEE